jgi:hypothetical protein
VQWELISSTTAGTDARRVDHPAGVDEHVVDELIDRIGHQPTADPGRASLTGPQNGSLPRRGGLPDPGEVLPKPGHNGTVISVSGSSWFVEFHPGCEKWADDLDQADAEALLAAIRVLRDQGPTLGRPLVDTIKGSRHNNMKELRPGSTGRTEMRVLFAFDIERQAILLVGGDKSDDWKGWYEMNIPIADDRFDEHQAELDAKRAKTKAAERSSKGKKARRGRR